MNSRPLQLALAVALGLASPALSAMGLGQLQVKSGLNQPLVAEIPIVSATPSELEQLDVRLASPEAFARIGLERPGELTANLQFSVGKNAKGQPVILVTTPNRFSEPLLNFLIEADWGKGAVTREYTALIDPPYIAAARVTPMQAPVVPPPQPASVIAAPAVAEPTPAVAEAGTVPATPAEPASPPTPTAPVAAQAEPAPVIAPPEPAVAPPEPAPAAEPEPPRPVAQAPAPEPARPQPPRPQALAQPRPAPTPAAKPGEVGPVARGQTLWSIANQVRPDAAVSVNQMMIALLRANPEAFEGDNVNRLRQGSVLRVPGQDEVARLSAAQAAELVNRQAAAWRTPRAPVPQPAETAAPGAESSPDVAAAQPARPAPRANAARLEIVPPSGAAARGAQSGAAAGAGGTELRAELVQAREELAARTAEADELRSRLADLEKQQADRQRLIELQNSQMKAMQERLHQLESQPAAPAAAAPAAAAPSAAPAQPWYLNPFVLGGAGLVLLGGLVLGMRRGRGKVEGDAPARRLSDDEALRASMAKTRAAAEPIKVEPVVAKPSAAAPPADAELTARREAVRARPQDLEAHLNLLRLFHQRGNAVDYEAAAQAMRAQVGSPMEPRWREAVVMGASLMPGHSLFSQAGWNTPRFETEPKAAPAPAAASAPANVPMPTVADGKVFDFPEEGELPAFQVSTPSARELDLDDEAAVMDETFGDAVRDIHRDEAKLMAEDASSATRIELAKAYLDIGDLDGARGMLEEVLIEGGPTAKAEAARILKEMG